MSDARHEIVSFFFTYPYLAFSLILFLIFCTFLILNRGQRHTMLLSGLLSAPFSFASVVFVPEYWSPVRVLESLTGIEDIIFSFSTGGIVWILAIKTARLQISLNQRTSLFLLRFSLCNFLGISVGFASYLSGIGVMSAALAGMMAVGCLMIFLRRDLWLISLSGSISFGLLYLVCMAIIFLLRPDFILQWNLENLWGPMILGVPLEEVIWAFAFGAVWPFIMVYLFDARIKKSGKLLLQQ